MAVGTAAVEVSTVAPLTLLAEVLEAADSVEAAIGPGIAAGIIAGSVIGAGAYYGGYGPSYYDNSYAYDNGYDGGYDNGYAVRNGFVCQPGTFFRGEDGRRYLCQ